MKNWREAVSALVLTLAALALTLFAAGLTVKIVTAICGVGFSWTVTAVAWLSALLTALWLLVRKR